MPGAAIALLAALAAITPIVWAVEVAVLVLLVALPAPIITVAGVIAALVAVEFVVVSFAHDSTPDLGWPESTEQVVSRFHVLEVNDHELLGVYTN
ncbi:MAG: hypothetical protein B7Y99_09010 [Caulobacterales bacterium 32-69-10]|nr:MAG: hypothetical protein B7Y99_09010 [Caulobacterales bacterium 32-69-10]